MVYISNGEHDNPHDLPKDNLEDSLDAVHHDYTQQIFCIKYQKR